MDSDVEVVEVESAAATAARNAALAEALVHYKPIIVQRGTQLFWKVENKTYCGIVIASQLKVVALPKNALTCKGKKRL
jgi:hypothetical protein